MVSKENVSDWLKVVRHRVDVVACLADAQLGKELRRVYIGGYRYNSTIL